jgi:3-phosphoshikimate 1-carboxyvinyltransferase
MFDNIFIPRYLLSWQHIKLARIVMAVIVTKAQEIGGTVTAPPSKSYTHRAFIIAGLARGTSTVRDYLDAADTMSTLHALEAFGIGMEKRERKVQIHGSGGRLKTPPGIIDCGNSGTSIRLLCGVAALDGEVTLTGDASVQRRPMGPLLDALRQLGVEADSVKGDGTPPVIIKGGGLGGGTVKVRGDVSSQFISSILISAPYASGDTTLEITTPLKSRPYVDITLDIMGRFGITVENRDYRAFTVRGKGRYRACGYTIEGDYSSSSYFLALAAMTGSEITVKNLFHDSVQGDAVILAILERMGADVRQGEKEVTVKGGTLEGIEVDLSDTPDLLPTVAALGTAAEGTTEIVNVEHARYKESDRISACAAEFRKFGVEIEERKDGLLIKGTGGNLKGATVETYHDHRMTMALAITGCCADGRTVINGAECVGISFPDFFEKMKGLGVEVEIRS